LVVVDPETTYASNRYVVPFAHALANVNTPLVPVASSTRSLPELVPGAAKWIDTIRVPADTNRIRCVSEVAVAFGVKYIFADALVDDTFHTAAPAAFAATTAPIDPWNASAELYVRPVLLMESNAVPDAPPEFAAETATPLVPPSKLLVAVVTKVRLPYRGNGLMGRHPPQPTARRKAATCP
jgi:hypothetical protein